MLCNRCETKMLRDLMFDLPRGFVEFYCINCGERIWVDTKRFDWAVRPN